MKKTIKAWAEFNRDGRINFRTIQKTEREVFGRIKEVYGWEKNYCHELGYRIRRITITVED